MQITARTKAERDWLEWMGGLPVFEHDDADDLAHDHDLDAAFAASVIASIEQCECSPYRLTIPDTDAGAWIAVEVLSDRSTAIEVAHYPQTQDVVIRLFDRLEQALTPEARALYEQWSAQEAELNAAAAAHIRDLLGH